MLNEHNGEETIGKSFDDEFHPDQIRSTESKEETVEPTVEETEPEVEVESTELKSELIQKAKWRQKFEESEAARKKLEAELNERNKTKSASLDVKDYIDISSSLDGLDPREKAYLAEQHRLSGKPLKEIRESEDFQLWDSAYRTKLEAEQRALKPNTQQFDEERPKTLTQALKTTRSISEKEELLRQAGLYKETRPRADRTNIGVTRSR